MSATGQPAEGTPPPAESGEPTTTTTTTEAPPGLDKIYERMDSMAAQQREFMQSVSQQLTPAEEEEEPDPADYYGDDGSLTEEGARAVIKELVDEQVQAQLAPQEAARLIERRDDAYEALQDEYPELADPKVAEPVLQSAIAWAQGNQGIIDRPEFVDVIEWVYTHGKYHELQETQAAEQPRSVVLESAQGAARQTQQQGPDWGDRIVKAAERLRPQI
jgi:hypothetical protein